MIEFMYKANYMIISYRPGMLWDLAFVTASHVVRMKIKVVRLTVFYKRRFDFICMM